MLFQIIADNESTNSIQQFIRICQKFNLSLSTNKAKCMAISKVTTRRKLEM